MALSFALNHMSVARLGCDDLMTLAHALGCVGIECRNDLPGPLFDGRDPEEMRQRLAEAGLRLLGVSEVKMFNDGHPDRMHEARALIAIAKAAGAESISLIPRCDGWRVDEAERDTLLKDALSALGPMLEDAGLIGLVEPLGFARSSLRTKAGAMDAIEATGWRDRFKLVHDTFHHALSAENLYFPEDTGVVHVSGVEDPSPGVADMEDHHRVLVGPDDRLGNAAQLTALIRGGYSGPVSLEAFSPDVHALADPRPAIAQSFAYLDHVTRDVVPASS